MQRWETVIEAQAGLYDWWGSSDGRSYAEGFRADVERKGRGSPLTDHLVEVQRAQLLVAEPFYVNDDAMALWQAAYPGFRPEAMMPEDLPCEAGFVLLPEPMFSLDMHAKRCAWRAFMWSPAAEDGPDGRRGIVLSEYSHIDDDDDYDFYDALRYEAARIGRNVWGAHGLGLLHVAPWWFGSRFPWEQGGENFYSEQTKEMMASLGYPLSQMTDSLYSFVQPVQCFWRLCQQTIMRPSRYQPARATRRRVARVKPEFERYVTVVELRRTKQQHETGEEAEPRAWDHRWMVGGHWRNQWYPSLNAHRQIYIHPYIKGPDDKPLKLRDFRAFEFIR